MNNIYFNTDNINLPRILNIYTDGSYNIKTKKTGWSFVCYYNNEVVHSDYGKLTGPITSMWQVGGEMVGVVNAIKHCKYNNCLAHIFYDLNNVKNWIGDLFGEKPWKTKNKYTQKYRKFMLDNQDYLYNMTWIKGHTGVEGNEEADKLAKKAIGLT